MRLESLERIGPRHYEAQLRGCSSAIGARLSHETLEGLATIVLRLVAIEPESLRRVDELFGSLAREPKDIPVRLQAWEKPTAPETSDFSSVQARITDR